MDKNSIDFHVKKIQIEILNEVKRICDKHDIKWYAIGGTLLGAVRHKGFIPWDVDIDIAMMREDYERFYEVAIKELKEMFEYESYVNMKKHYSPHAKIYRKDTKFILGFKGTDIYKRLNDNKGIFIDIFPLDDAPKEFRLQKKQDKKLRKLKRLRALKMGLVYDKGILRWKLILKRIIQLLLLPISIRQINKIMDNTMKKYSGSNSGFVVSMASRYSYTKQYMEKEIYGEPVSIKFEKTLINAPQQKEKYLTQLYNDYMVLPPKSEIDSYEDMIIHVKLPND